MKSRTSLFNLTIFCNFLKRYWLMWVGYCGLLLFSVCLPLLDALQEYARWPDSYSTAYAGCGRLLGSIETFPLLISLLGCGVIAAISFSYLYNSRHVGMMNSLPIRRETLFCSVILADMAGLLLADLAVVLVCLAMEAAFGVVNFYAIGVSLLVLVLENVLFLGFAVFCCMLTGNIFAGPAVYLIFNFTAVAVEFMGTYLLSNLQFGNGGAMAVGHAYWLSPPVWLVSRLQCAVVDGPAEAYQLTGLGGLSAYALAGVVFGVLALLLYRKRRMETAGDMVSIEFLKPVFKVCASLAGALGLACLVKDSLSNLNTSGVTGLAYLCALMVIGGVIGWFIAQMLVEKTIHVFNHGWKGVGVMSLLFVLFLCGAEFDWYGYERNIPETDRVESVTLSCSTAPSAVLETPESIDLVTQLHRSIVDHKDLHEQAERDYASRQNISLSYQLKNGKYLHREYWIDAGEDAYLDHGSDLWMLEAAVNTPEAIQDRYVVDFPVSAGNITECYIAYIGGETMEWTDFYDLTPAEQARLYNECVLPDLQDGTLGYINVVENDDYANYKYDCSIRFELRYPKGSGEEAAHRNYTYWTTQDGVTYYHTYFTLYLTTDAARTVEFLNDHGIFPATVMESARAQGGDYTSSGYVMPQYDWAKEASGDLADAAFTRRG